ncbi:MAG: CdaR family protein [Nitrospirota bacterium]
MKHIVFSNAGLKVLAVGLAISMWFFVTYRGQSEMAVEAPIVFKNIPKGLELQKESVKSVVLNLRGHERLLKNLRPADIGVVVDLSAARKGEATYYFDKGGIATPRTVEILRIEPTHVRVVLDESVTKVVPVKVPLVGTPERGYRVVSVEVKPSSVAVAGAQAELARIAVLRTEPVDITGLDSDIHQSIKLNPGGRNIRTALSEVTVSIAIKRVER